MKSRQGNADGRFAYEGLDRVITVRYDEETGSARLETELPGGGTQVDVQAGAAD